MSQVFKLDGRKGYPMYLTATRPQNGQQLVKFVTLEDCFLGDTLVNGYRKYRVDEIVEERPANGVHDSGLKPIYYEVRATIIEDLTPVQPPKETKKNEQN